MRAVFGAGLELGLLRRGCCDTCDFRDTASRFLGVESLRHWARSWGLGRGCRGSRRGVTAVQRTGFIKVRSP
jgi:uncharacterized protein with von Willebrand factor type A (vWA) domain